MHMIIHLKWQIWSSDIACIGHTLSEFSVYMLVQ